MNGIKNFVKMVIKHEENRHIMYANTPDMPMWNGYAHSWLSHGIEYRTYETMMKIRAKVLTVVKVLMMMAMVAGIAGVGVMGLNGMMDAEMAANVLVVLYLVCMVGMFHKGAIRRVRRVHRAVTRKVLSVVASVVG